MVKTGFYSQSRIINMFLNKPLFSKINENPEEYQKVLQEVQQAHAAQGFLSQKKEPEIA